MLDLSIDVQTSIHNRAMGFLTEFFPDLFVIPRMAGYVSHWRESLDDPDTMIMRPAQVCFFLVFSFFYFVWKSRLPFF